MIKTDETEEVIQSLDLVAGRRAFIKALGFGAVGAAVFGVAEGLVTPAMAQAAGLTDTQILNFALNLEYLESAFYSYAYTGKDIPAKYLPAGANNPGQTPGTLVGGAKVPFANKLVRAYANEISAEELKHVIVLRTVLGADAVARPAIDIGPAFAAAAQAAGLGTGFNAYANDLTFLFASYIFEDVGVTAYHGAASFISNADVLEAAAGILAVEAYHAGIIRTSLLAQDVANGNTTNAMVTGQISALRSSLANGASTMDAPLVDDIGIGTITGTYGPTVVDVNAPNANMYVEITDPPRGDAIAYSRSVRQVLNVVYGKQNAASGLFFPAGINPGPSGRQAS